MKTISLQQNQTRAVSKYIRMSPSKIRRVLRQIQGKSYKEGLLILEFLASIILSIKSGFPQQQMQNTIRGLMSQNLLLNLLLQIKDR